MCYSRTPDGYLEVLIALEYGTVVLDLVLLYRKAPTLSDKVLPHLPTRQGSGRRPGFGPPQPPRGR